MIDSDNVVVQCPNGHQVQAARTHLHLVLACPVCSTHFVPVPATADGAHNLAYADGHVGLPIRRPAYTRWLIGLWMTVAIMAVLLGIYTALFFDAIAKPSGPNLVVMGWSCVSTPIGLAAIILQLMWIYRIHSDAGRGGYTAIAPGLALGLSFVPYFQYPWTAWTLRKLAGFAASGERAVDANAAAAMRLARVCFVLGIVYAASNVILAGLTTASTIRMFFSAMQSGAMSSGTPPVVEMPPHLMAFSIAGGVLSVFVTFVYVRTVQRVERSLYDFLGAPPRA